MTKFVGFCSKTYNNIKDNNDEGKLKKQKVQKSVL